jgi:hypothetical protein
MALRPPKAAILLTAKSSYSVLRPPLTFTQMTPGLQKGKPQRRHSTRGPGAVLSVLPLVGGRAKGYRPPPELTLAEPKSPMDVATWLQSLGLERYAPAFRDNEIDWEVLPKLTSEDLKEIGVAAIGHRRKLLDAIAAQRCRRAT